MELIWDPEKRQRNTIAFTEPVDDMIRLISMRKATRNEQRIYFKKLSD